MRKSVVQRVLSSLVVACLPACGPQTAPELAPGATDGAPLEILPGASVEIPSLGTGWSVPGEKYAGRCIVAPFKRLPAADAASTLRVSSMIDGEKAQAQLGLGVGLKAHFGIASASLQAQAASAMTKDAFSSVW